MPVTGAPGGVLLYALIGAIVWPKDRPGGVLGVRGARTAWAALWLVMAWLWLLAPSSGANGIHDAIMVSPSGMSWLTSVQNGFVSITNGNGVVFAIVLSAASIAIAFAVLMNWRAKEFLILATVLNLIFWVVGRGLGGIPAGGETDPNAGLLFVVLAYRLTPPSVRAAARARDETQRPRATHRRGVVRRTDTSKRISEPARRAHRTAGVRGRQPPAASPFRVRSSSHDSRRRGCPARASTVNRQHHADVAERDGRRTPSTSAGVAWPPRPSANEVPAWMRELDIATRKADWVPAASGAPVAGQWQGQKRHELRGTSCGALNPCVTSTAPSIGGGPTNGVRREARLMLVAQRDGMRRPISVAAGSGSAT